MSKMSSFLRKSCILLLCVCVLIGCSKNSEQTSSFDGMTRDLLDTSSEEYGAEDFGTIPSGDVLSGSEGVLENKDTDNESNDEDNSNNDPIENN